MPNMPLDRGRNLQGRAQVVIFRSIGTECVWMDVFEAKRAVEGFPDEWAKEPFEGMSYDAPSDPFFVEVGRGGVSPIDRPWGW